MKKFLCVVLLSLLLCSVFCLSAFALTEVRYASVDDNSTVSAEDARLILRKSVNLESFDIYKLKAADIDFDGIVSAADARLALRMSVKLEALKPVSDVSTLLHASSYYVSCSITNESGTTPLVSAKDGNNLMFSIPADTFTFNYIKNDSGRFIVYNDNYIPLTDAALKLLGVDAEISSLDETLNTNTSILAKMLEGYEESQTFIEVDSNMVPRNKTVISGAAGAYTVVYETIDGQLISIEAFTSRGTSTNRIDFDITTSVIPDGLMNSKGLKESDLFEFLLQAYNDSGFMNMLDRLSLKK